MVMDSLLYICQVKCNIIKAGKVEDELHLFLDCPSYAHLRQDFFEKIKSILGEVNQKVFNKRQMIALLNSNSPKLLNSQGKDVIHLLLYQLCMISKHDFHVEYYSTCPSQFQESGH
jgi:hypothetical protein